MAAVPSIGRATRVEGSTEREGDATRALYEAHANQIFRYCLHQLGSREEAEDAVQSTFLNAFRGLKRGVVPELEAAWLFKIAHNVCLSRRRSSWRRGRVESPADFQAVEELQPAPARVADELIGLQDVLEQMPESQRRAILLREWQGLSYREIAAELELSQGAVETLIFRARRSLAAGLEQPPAPTKRRLRRGADLGALAAGLKGLLLGGSAAVKIAAAVAVVGATTLAAGAPVLKHRTHPPAAGQHPGVVARAPARPAVGAKAAPPRSEVPPASPVVARPAPAQARHRVAPKEHAKRVRPAAPGPFAAGTRQETHPGHGLASAGTKSRTAASARPGRVAKAGPGTGAKRRAAPPAAVGQRHTGPKAHRAKATVPTAAAPHAASPAADAHGAAGKGKAA